MRSRSAFFILPVTFFFAHTASPASAQSSANSECNDLPADECAVLIEFRKEKLRKEIAAAQARLQALESAQTASTMAAKLANNTTQLAQSESEISRDKPAKETGAKGAPKAPNGQNILSAEEKQKAETEAARKEAARKRVQEESNIKKVGGIDFGVGLAFTYDLGSNDRVKEAELINGIVRVIDEENVTGRFMLESHYFFTPKTRFLGLDKDQWGVGPFIAIEASSDPIIQAIGGGIMFGFRKKNAGEVSNDSFNLGFGAVFDLNQQVLGEGIVANQPLPDGETEIRFLEKEQSGFLILSSYSF